MKRVRQSTGDEEGRLADEGAQQGAGGERLGREADEAQQDARLARLVRLVPRVALLARARQQARLAAALGAVDDQRVPLRSRQIPGSIEIRTLYKNSQQFTTFHSCLPPSLTEVAQLK